MSRTDQRHVFRIFDEARQRDAAERPAFVDDSCGADHALRKEVLALLDADAASGEFLQQPALERLAQSMARTPWSLRAGEAIGPYTIVELLGAGGAGEVWRARDERLGRDVAIKALLPHAAGDSDRLRRFAEEARAAGALNHSNILTVYDVGEHDGIPYLVSECLDGRSLRERVDEGPVAAGEAIAIARDVARGLATAHARGIVHRDLKPENIFLRADGGAKILDFGLAKLQQSLEGVAHPRHHTMTAVIVGTAGYMAPEQARGEDVDARADLFALGVMLYEMVTGRNPFGRASTFETLHAILTFDPPDPSTTSPRLPPGLPRIVTRLVDKAPGSRFQSAADLDWALSQVDASTAATVASPARLVALLRLHEWPSPWPLAIAAATVALAAWAWFGRPVDRGPRNAALTRFTWSLPDGMGLASVPVVSPVANRLAFVARTGDASRLYVRDLGAEAAVAIPGSDGAQHPFWSPDGTSLGFFAGGRLMKVAWNGGAPTPLTTAPFPMGATWGASGSIVFAPDVIMTGLSRVRPIDGAAEPATVLEPALGDNSHCWPAFLPDGKRFLYFVRSARDERRGIYLGRVDGPARPAGAQLLHTDSNAIYVPSTGSAEGVLVYVAGGRIEARRFDWRTLRFSGDARTIGAHAAGTALTEPAMLSASPEVLAFASSNVPYQSANHLEAVDRRGQRLRLWDHPEAQNFPRLSPDGRYLARTRVDERRNTPDIWVEDLERGPLVRVTTAVEPDLRPAWSPDGRHLAFVTGTVPGRPGTRTLNIAAADGTGVVESRPCPGDYCEPTDWTMGGLLLNVLDGGRTRVWLVPADGTAPRPLLDESFEGRDARLSADGRWVVYVSNESGRPEVSVRSVAGRPTRIPISSAGGDYPVWRGDGAELLFIDPRGRLQSVPVQWSGGRPAFGRPRPLDVPTIGRGHWGTPYDVTADGERIYFLRRSDAPLPRDIHVIIGWRALLQ